MAIFTYYRRLVYNIAPIVNATALGLAYPAARGIGVIDHGTEA